MAGNDQRPTDDTEGHGTTFPEDETTGDDRGTRNPDDTEGHMPYRWGQDSEAVDEDQVDKHRRPRPEALTDKEQ